jgi:hypothetical protein
VTASDQSAADDEGKNCCVFQPLQALNRFGRCCDQRDERTQEPPGVKNNNPNGPIRTLIPGTNKLVIGACAPIHPRVDYAARPDVPIRAGMLSPTPRSTARLRAVPIES